LVEVSDPGLRLKVATAFGRLLHNLQEVLEANSRFRATLVDHFGKMCGSVSLEIQAAAAYNFPGVVAALQEFECVEEGMAALIAS
jgi:hypothetical protein